MKKLTSEQKQMRRRILEISHELRLSHLGSCLSVIDILCAVYKAKKKNERFILSNGHAGIALYAVLEKYGFVDIGNIKKFFIHPDRNPKFGLDLSTGSLGHGLPVALGMALADRTKKVYCVVSDGECAEGSIWEALRVGVEREAVNLKIVVNANGWSAYDPVSLSSLKKRFMGFGYDVLDVDGHSVKELLQAIHQGKHGRPSLVFARTKVDHFPFLKGQDAHYYTMSENDYCLAMEALR